MDSNYSNKLYRKTKLFCLSSIIVLAAYLIIPNYAAAQNLDVPYVPTPHSVVEKMLDLANVQAGDYVIDLGSGDGRIVIAAAKRGAAGHGIDLDPERVREARQNAREAGVTDRVIFMKENIFDTDFSRASVITMYLLTSVNRKLRPHLLEDLEPGTRVVSHSFNMGEWKADKKVTVSSNARPHDVYFWIIPANAKGNWTWETDGQSFSLTVSQEYQEIEPALNAGGREMEISNAVLKGKRISFRAGGEDFFYLFNGKIEGDQIKGTVQIHKGEDDRVTTWNATR